MNCKRCNIPGAPHELAAGGRCFKCLAEFVESIDFLRGLDGMGNSVELISDHDEEKKSVICCFSEFTLWEERHYYAETTHDALLLAVKDKREFEALHK